MSAGLKFGLAGVKSLLSPVGMCILSILCIILLGFNPLFLVFDLIVKSMNIISGNALIQEVVNGTFDTSSPVFIIYITVFVVSFILLMVKLIKNGINDIGANKLDLNTGKERVNTFSGAKLKWIVIWIIGWLCLPFVFGIIMFIINIFSNLFAINSLTINSLFKYTADDFIGSLNQIRMAINSTQTSVSDILNTYFPEDISQVTSVPYDLEVKGMNLDQFKIMLTELSKNSDALAFKNQLIAIKSKIINLNNLPIFNYNASTIISISVKETQELINQLITQLNGLNDFIHKDNVIQFGPIEIVFSKLVESNKWDVNIQEGLFNLVGNFKTTINEVPAKLINSFNNSQLVGIGVYGVDGQKNNLNELGYSSEKLTVQLASALYQRPIYSWNMNLHSSSDSIVSNIPVIGTVISIVNNIAYVLKDPLSIIDLTISTFAFAFTFTTFWSLLIMFAGKFFDFISMLLVGPFASIAGVSDNGEKFQVWFKTFFGKALIVFIISFSLSLFIVAVDVFAKFIKPENLGQYAQNSNSFFINMLCKFLIMILTIATCSAMLEFINWSAQTLSFDTKVEKYANNWTRKKMNAMNNMEQAHNNVLMTGGYRRGGGGGSTQQAEPPNIKIPKQ